MVPGVETALIIEIVRHVGVLVAQILLAVTQIFPPVVPDVTEMDVVPCPELMVHPEGTVQLYDVAPDTADIE